MRYYWPTVQDMLGTLPRDERDELLLLIETAPGDRTWLPVPPAVWDAFTTAVKRGDYDQE